MHSTTTPAFAARAHELPSVLATIYQAELHAARRPGGAAIGTCLALRAGTVATAATGAAAALVGGHPPAAVVLLVVMLAVTVSPLALTVLPGWIAWTTLDRRQVTITDPHAVQVRTWHLDQPVRIDRAEAITARSVDAAARHNHAVGTVDHSGLHDRWTPLPPR